METWALPMQSHFSRASVSNENCLLNVDQLTDKSRLVLYKSLLSSFDSCFGVDAHHRGNFCHLERERENSL
jgi:hypothetical protein